MKNLYQLELSLEQTNLAIKLLQKTKAKVSIFLTLIELTNLKGRKKIKVKTDSLLSFDE